MKVNAVVLDDGRVELRTIELKPLHPGWSRIRVLKAGLCGTDVAKIFGEVLRNSRSRLVLGHEFVGQVHAVGSSVEKIEVGSKVVCMPVMACGTCSACIDGRHNLCEREEAIGRSVFGAFAEYVDVPTTNLFVLPEGAPLDPYVLADPLAVGIHAVNLAGSSLSNCLVVGDGAIGCLTAWVLKQKGSNVWIRGFHEKNLDFMSGLGVGRQEESGLTSFDAVFEAVGRSQPSSLDSSLQLVSKGGTVVVVGVFEPNYEYALDARGLFIREVRLLGSNAYLESDFRETVGMIASHGQELGDFITHRFSLSQFEDALATVRKKDGRTLKVVLEVGEPS